LGWELEYQEKAFVVEAAIERGAPLPSWANNEPEVYPIDEFYLSAFSELSTCRQIGMGTGPIPWGEIAQFAQFSGLDDENFSTFVQVMRAMDSVYLKWVGKKQGNA
jgi:hypothetical protein